MRILLLAPGVREPWTEGRKNLVRDLQQEFARRGFDVSIAAGVSGKSGFRMLWSALSQSRSLLRLSQQDLLIPFPFGRFRGYRGLGNVAFVLAARIIAAFHGVRMLTVLYSVDGYGLDTLARLFGRLAAVGRRAGHVSFMHLGMGDAAADWLGSGDEVPHLLFLCGYQKGDVASVRGVLDERGLGLLASALRHLRRPVKLTVAIPFLRQAHVQAELARILAARPGLEVRWDAESSPLQALKKHDIFVFPYQGKHEVFVPTSMLEAMAIGIPVVATDLPMYRELTCPEGEPACFLFSPDDGKALADALEQCVAEHSRAVAMAKQQRKYVRAHWTIVRAADDILGAAGVSQSTI